MTSPTDPPNESLTERISSRISFGGSSSVHDPEERHTRNVTIAFVVLILVAAVVIVAGLGYGFYDANLKPLGNVDGTPISRGEYEDRVALEAFRLERAERAVRAGLADGSLNEDLANRRLTTISNAIPAVGTASIESLVDLTLQRQLADERGIVLAEDELAAALAADGATAEARRISALIVRSAEEELGLPPTPQGRADAEANAEAALAALDSGTPFADVAAEYSPATAALGGDLGYLERDDFTDQAWSDAMYLLEEGETTEILRGEEGEYLIGRVTEIVPAQPDVGYLTAIREAVGEAAHTRNVELEAIAEKLEESVVAEAVATEFDQVQLSEILITGDTFVDPEEDEGSIRASHILYAPEQIDGETPPQDDATWDDAEALAVLAATQLRAVDSPVDRATAFASRAASDSDGPTGVNGGDLGYFSRDAMVTEFADSLFDAPDLERGDVVGPVRTDFGWHVIMFDDRRAPLADRLAEAEAALAADGADFSAVASAYSDGASALGGGEIGWVRVDDLDELTAIALGATEIGEMTEPVDGDLGYYIYLKQDEATQPLDPQAAARYAGTAFQDWYDELRFTAEDEGRISIDGSFYEVPENAPQGHSG